MRYCTTYATSVYARNHGCMDVTMTDEMDVGPNSTEDLAIPTAAPDVEELNRQRIRFDGIFTGPTW